VSESHPAPGVQRLAAAALLLVGGALSLPLAAFALDGEGTENLILPAQLAAMAVFGAAVGYLLPGLAGPAAARSRSALVGAGVGLLLAVLAVLVFFVLLGG
jgi:hypothetical protein